MSKTDSTNTFLAFCNVVAQSLITVSPFIVIIAVLKHRRNALYIPTETLFLLCVAYVARYLALIIIHPLTPEQPVEKVHLTGLFVAAWLVYQHNNSVYVEPWSPTTRRQSPDAKMPLLVDEDVPLEPQLLDRQIRDQRHLHRMVDLHPDDRYGLKLHPAALYTPIVISLIWAVISYSFLVKPNTPLARVWTGPLTFFALMVESSAMLLQTLRTATVYHLSKVDLNTVERFCRALTPEERKAGVPLFLWVLNVAVHLGTVARLPQLWADTRESWEKGDDESPVPFMAALFTFMQPFMFVSMMVFIRVLVRFQTANNGAGRFK